MQRSRLIVLVLAALSAPVLASVSVKDPWVRTTNSFQKSTVAFMQLTSSEDARLVKADSPVAKTVEIHAMVMKNYVMRMQTIPAIELPAGKSVELKADGYMVMLTGLKQQIKDGDTIPISIVIEGKDRKRETIHIVASAMNMDTAADGKKDHEHTEDHDYVHRSMDDHEPMPAHDHEHMH